VTGVEGKGRIISVQTDDPESITGYQVWRLLQGQEGTPASWVSIGTPVATNLTDNSWPSLPCNPYRWAVKAQYTGNRWSNASFSNVIGKCNTVTVGVYVTLTCAAMQPENALITLTNSVYPDTVYTHLTDTSGAWVFHNVWKGTYNLTVTKYGYTPYTTSSPIQFDKDFFVTLMQLKGAPRNLVVDDRSLFSTWSPPSSSVTIFTEAWTSASFATNQWVISGTNSGGNWQVTTGFGNPAPSVMFNWTPEQLNYDEYLTSKVFAGLGSPGMSIGYDIYLSNFSTSSENTMAIELWDGTTWHVLKTYSNLQGSFNWKSEVVDASAYSNLSAFQIRFHAAGADSYDINNWNIDNIKLNATDAPGYNPCILGYNYYLNNVLSGFTMDTTYLIPASQVTYGQTYQACVLAIWGSGYSPKTCVSFTSHFLYPPTQMGVTVLDCSALITWHKPGTGDAPQVIDIQPWGEPAAPGTDRAPYHVITSNTNYSDALWDVLFTWNCDQAACPGIEQDQNSVYTTSWQSGYGAPPWFHKYNKMTGAVIEHFDIPGATAIRDMASDASIAPIFYGSPTTSSLYKMNFQTHTLVSTIATGVSGGIRHLAYDPGLNAGGGGFWCGNWYDMYAISMTGTVLFTGPAQNSTYGDAYDNQSANGPFLWTFSQSGAHLQDLTQYKIQSTAPYLVATGITHDAGTLPGASAGTAGGLCAGPVNQKYALIGNIQLDPNMVFAYEIANYSTPTPVLGLKGYRVYRDDAPIARIVPGPDTLWYYDMNAGPGTFAYGVAAIYDLSAYGLTGEGESLPDGPLNLTINCGRPLPFFEPWNSANFSFNEWSFNPLQYNWSVNTGLGNPAPTADFSWDPLLVNYNAALESPVLDASMYTCAKLWFDFDYKLVDRNGTSAEKLDADVFYDNSWHTKATYVNDGSTNWLPAHFEVSQAKGKGMKVRFRAYGANSADILHWYVDNIHVYGICSPPQTVAADVQDNDVYLTWAAPDCGPHGQVMTFIFDDGVWENGFCINPGYEAWFGNQFPIASTMAGQLQLFSIYWVDNGSGSPQTLTIDVFDGAQTLIGSTDPFLASPIDQFIDVPVNNIPFTGMFYAMVHWNNTPAQSYFLATDENGPYVAQDLAYYFDGSTWSTASSVMGTSGDVFLMRATALVFSDMKTVQLTPTQAITGKPVLPPSAFGKVNRSGDSGNHTIMGITDNLADSSLLIGYNVYRKGDTVGGSFVKINPSLLTVTQYADMNLPYGNYKYYVTSNFNDSEAGIFLCESSSDTIPAALIVGVNNLNSGSVSIYPNPATDVVNVKSDYNITNIEVMNYIGQVVYSKKETDSRLVKINTSSFEAGVYFVKVTTSQGVRTAKITVM